MGGPKKSRKRRGAPPLKSVVVDDINFYRDINVVGDKIVRRLGERYQGNELEAALIILAAAISRKLYEVQEWDNDAE